MRWENLYLAGLGHYLPERVITAEEAVAAGHYDANLCASNGYRSVHVAAEGETGPVMAAKAGRVALARSGLAPADIDLFIHTYAGFQGRDMWVPGSYIQNEVLGDASDGPAFEVRGGCNGGLSALELAASYIAVRPNARAALITTGDAFHLPYVNRWSSDEQTVYGDGAGAMVLSTVGGFARIRATVSGGDPSLEALERGSEPFSMSPFPDRKTVDFTARKRDFLSRDDNALADVLSRMARIGDQVLKQALEEAETDIGSVKFCTHTTFAEPIGQYGVYGRLGFQRHTSSFDWAQGIGQMGAGDEIIGMSHLAETRSPQPGDLLVAIGGGTGFICTVAVIEFLATPQW